MTIAEYETGSQTATLDTEHTLNTTSPNTNDGVYVLVVDLGNMVDGDITILRAYERARSGDTTIIAGEVVYAHTQATPLAMSPAMLLLHGWNFTLEQTDGTGRAYPWSIRRIS